MGRWVVGKKKVMGRWVVGRRYWIMTIPSKGWQLREAKHRKRIANFGDHIADGELLTVVLNQVVPFPPPASCLPPPASNSNPAPSTPSALCASSRFALRSLLAGHASTRQRRRGVLVLAGVPSSSHRCACCVGNGRGRAAGRDAAAKLVLDESRNGCRWR